MRILQLLFVLVGSFVFMHCQQQPKMSEEAYWRLGWRMIESKMGEDYATAELRFDSLLAAGESMDRMFLANGLEAKLQLGKNEEIAMLLAKQEVSTLTRICIKDGLKEFPACEAYGIERVSNEALRQELIEMFIADQAIRENLMTDLITKYQIDTTQLLGANSMNEVDERNRNRLKEIFAETGFPDRDQVGFDAMRGVFMMIQHSDRDKDWQKAQLSKVKKAVQQGDLEGQRYAYLYDRIKVNAGEPQRYGTQFAKVDPVSKTVELQPVEDIEHLDNRRREMGMMPIKMYKEFVFNTL